MAKRKMSPQLEWVGNVPGTRQKLRRTTERDRLDELINWYEKNKPEMEHVMPGGVGMKPDELDKFASKLDDETWVYRGWTLKKAEVPAKVSERMKIAK